MTDSETRFTKLQAGDSQLAPSLTATLTRWEVAYHLFSKEDVQLYLQMCVDEDPRDSSLIREALSEIARARIMSQLARDIGMSRD